MKYFDKIIFNVCVILACVVLIRCGGSGTSSSNAADNMDDTNASDTDYRQLMRNFVQGISSYAKGIDPAFVIIPQNGHALLTQNGEATGEADATYLAAIDGVGREDLFYGYDTDNTATSDADTSDMTAFMDVAEANNVEVLATDYCSTESYMLDSYQQNAAKGYISFAADDRTLNDIPSYPAAPYNENAANVTTLTDAKNFLYLLNMDSYASKNAFINAVAATNYDLLITDLYFQASAAFSAADITDLKAKANGGERLVIAYMSIGEAENYRSYWQSDWEVGSPSWISDENEEWEGNYKVEYWNSEWQAVIYGNDNSYLKQILNAGFDGVYLDIIDAYEYFEDE
ncbi:MAG: endo alpha-1,4 polygalactosaminidase [Deltaproteobacteria bacterium]|nr:endo alpha-1,4 polygalactosaminidase [Deltaproteobacteria bacterium]